MEENSALVLKRLAWWVYRRNVGRHKPYHLFLATLPEGNFIDYIPLVRLMLNGYFSVIVTLNDASLLQKVFEEQGGESSQYHVLTVGLDEEEEIVDALYGQAPGICIIQLSANTSEQPVFSPEILGHLQNYFSQDIIIVGLVKQEEAYLHSLQAREAGHIFYVVLGEPMEDDYIIRLMDQKNQSPKEFLIVNNLMAFRLFFRELENLLSMYMQKEEHDKLISCFPPLPSVATSSPSVLGEANPMASANNGISGSMQEKNIPLPVPVVPSAIIIKNSIPPGDLNGGPPRADVLLVTVTHTETMGVFSQVDNKERVSLLGRVYYDLGFIGSARTFLVQSTGMGPLGVSPCLEDGITALNPEILLMVGIAFGCKPQEQALGDILISQQIAGYDLQKVSRGPKNVRVTHYRGSRSDPAERLLNHFMSGKHVWVPPPAIHFGVIVSGAKVVNHAGLRDELLRCAPEAIGGEMEGVALEKVATRKRREWMLIKGICDWADGNKDDAYQRIAAENAARFTLQVVQQDEFVLRR